MSFKFRALACLMLALPLAADGQSMLKEAMAYYYSNGAIALIKEANSGKFHDSPAGFLMVLDESGKTLIHGESSKFIGVNMSNMKDANGRLFVKETLDAKGKGKGRTSFAQAKGGTQVKRVMLWEFQEGLLFSWVMDEK